MKRALVLSVLLHLLLIVVWRFALQDEKSARSRSTLTWIEVNPKPLSKPQVTSKPENRMVQTETGKKIDTPDPEAFLGFQNQKVDRQTVSRHRATVQGRQGESSQNHAQSSQSSTESSSMSNLQANQKKQVSVNSLGVPILPKHSLSGSKQGEGYAPEWATPGLRPQDHINGIAESDHTALNTKEFMFYGYFQRIRAQLDQAWTPLLRQKLLNLYKQGRSLASDQDHLTQLLVVLNEGGEITRVQVVLESGLIDLDDAAVAAFRKAGPFPHPPRGMTDQNREIKISWDFILKT